MRINSTYRENFIKKDYSKYVVYAILSAFLVALFLNLFVKLAIIVFNLAVKYWWGAIIIVLIILFFRRRRKKK